MGIEASRMTPIDDEYGTCERTFAELRIYGRDLDPESITSHIGIQPSSRQKTGEVKTNSHGFKRTIKLGGWFYSSEGHVQSKDVRRHLDWLLRRLAPIKSKICSMQTIDGISMTVSCLCWSVGGGGPTLWPEQMQLLAELNLECTFDVAFVGNDGGK